MAEKNIVVDDEKEVVTGGDSGFGSEPKSPWRRPVVNPADSPVMGTETWPAGPALSDVQLSKSPDGSATNSQASAGLQKPQGGGNGNFSHKHEHSRYHRSRSKRNPNGMPPFPVPLPYSQPVVPHVYPPMRPIPPPIPLHGYGYQPMPAPFPGAHNQLGRSGTWIPMQASGPPVYGMDAQAFGPRDGIVMQQSTAPRAYTRPASYGPVPFGGGPAFPGTRPMYYPPLPPPGSVWAPFPPRFPPPVGNTLVPVLPLETMALKENIVKQIEYYFSDENLPTDHYLISQMDGEGWVPISIIAGFRRVKRMSTDTLFILDALQSSQSVQVQGDKVRKRDGRSKYIVVSPSKCIDEPATDVKNNLLSEQGVDSTTESLLESDLGVNLSSAKETLDNVLDMDNDKSVEEAMTNNMKQTSSDEHALLNESVVLHANIKSSCIGSLPVADSSSGTNLKDGGVDVLSDSAANVDNLSNDFAGTLMLGEELEKEREMDDYYSVSRVFHHYCESQDQKEPLKKHAELERVLIEEFCSLEEFQRSNEKMATTANADNQKPAQAMTGALVA